jgi:hypothetical protein
MPLSLPPRKRPTTNGTPPRLSHAGACSAPPVPQHHNFLSFPSQCEGAIFLTLLYITTYLRKLLGFILLEVS